MLSTRLFIGTVLLLLNSIVYGQNIKVKVVNQTNETSLPNALVQIQDINAAKYTNELGEATFNNILSGNYTLTISGLDIETQTVSFTSEGKSSELLVKAVKTDIRLEEVVIVSDIVRKKEFINKLDIALRPLNNSQEVLRMIPGLFIGQHAGGGKAEQIFLRGFDIDHGTDIQINVDGMPVNMVSHAHGQGYADLHFVIPELIERVDFSKGPYLAEKGNFTTAGWVDFRTAKHLEQNFIKAEMGQFDTYRALAAVNLLKPSDKSGGKSAYIAGEYNFSNSYFDAPQNFNRINVMGKWNNRLSQTTDLSITASYFSSEWNHSGQIPDRAVNQGLIGFFGSIDPTEGGNTARSNLNVQTTTSWQNGALLKNQLFYTRYQFQLFSNFTFFLEDSISGDQIRQAEKRDILGYNTSYMTYHQLGSKKAEFTIGAQARYDRVEDNELSKTTNRTDLRERIQYGDVHEWNLALFANEHITLNSKWSLDLGLRLDYFNNEYIDKKLNNASSRASAAILLPKFSLYYTPSSNFQCYLKTGKGFHSNDTRVVVPQQGKEILPAAYGTDLGIVWKPLPRLIVQPALWYLWLDQEFVYVGDAGIVEASGKSRRIGFDFLMKYQVTKNLFLDIESNLNQPRSLEEAKGADYIPLAPIFTSVIGLNYIPTKSFSASIRGRYLGDRPANEDYSVVAQGYFITDLQISYQLKAFKGTLLINNLFNSRWKETQFNTLSRLKNEPTPVEEIHFTPGSPFFARFALTYNF